MGAMTNARRDDDANDTAARDADANPVRPSGAAPQFHETWPQYLRRLVLGVLYALRPSRISILPRLWLMTITYYLTPRSERDKLPAVPRFYSERGLIGISNDLSVRALVDNYSRGFFPVCHIGPMKWWCPEERSVIDPAEAHVSRKVRRLLRQHKYTITMDTAFASVMEACARPREGKVPLTWITPQIMRAYWKAYKAGYAHSVEVWDKDGALVGGLYGLTIGKVYFGESQFCAVRDVSKIANAVLNRHLAEWGYRLHDSKWMTPHLATLGFWSMERETFRSLIQWYVEEPGEPGQWTIDPNLDFSDWPKEPKDRSSVPQPAPQKVA